MNAEKQNKMTEAGISRVCGGLDCENKCRHSIIEHVISSIFLDISQSNVEAFCQRI